MSVFLKEKYELKVNARQLTLHDNDRYGRLATFFMEVMCGKSCLNFDGDDKIK
jgi:predicted AAA+ superfamily ATPase